MRALTDSTNAGYGNLIDIEHDGGFMTRYAHCNKIKKSTGDAIRRGEVLGETGNSGRSTGPHLHFEIRKVLLAKALACMP